MMKKLLILLILVLGLSACSGAAQAPVDENPTEVPLEDQIAKSVEETVAVASTQKAEQEAQDKAAEPTSTETPTPEPSDTPTATAEPTEEPSATPTATPIAFDPQAEYGGATVLDTFATNGNWVGGDGKLPNSDYLRLALGANQLLVTGKPAGFDTWWFTYLGAGDQFLQMKAEVENCDPGQSYGLIVRGSAAASDTHGYIYTFDCDGSYRLRRLDGTNPYNVTDLVSSTESDAINAGDDELNLLGIRFVGDTITLYANGEQLEEITDDNYGSGQFGLFVNAGAAGNFTFIVDEIAFWDLD